MNSRAAALALGFSSAGHFFAHLLMLLYPTVVLALEGRWGMSYGDLLSLSLGGFVLFGLGALPAGWLGDRWSDEGMMVVFFIGTGGAAIATGLTGGPVALALGLATIGLFGSIYHPVGTAWLMRSTKNRGRALGVNGIAGSIGLGAAAFVAGALAQTIGWRAAFVIPGALCAATGLALLFCIRGGREVAARIENRPEPEAARSDVVRTFIVLSFTMLADGTISQAIPVALPKAFAAGLTGLTDGGTLDAGGFVTLVFLVAATAQLVGGWLARPLRAEGCLCLRMGGSGAVVLHRRASTRRAAARRNDRGQLSRRAVGAGRERAARARLAGPLARHRLWRQVSVGAGRQHNRRQARRRDL